MNLGLNERPFTGRVLRLQTQRVLSPLGTQRPLQNHIGRTNRLRTVDVFNPYEAAVLARRPVYGILPL